MLKCCRELQQEKTKLLLDYTWVRKTCLQLHQEILWLKLLVVHYLKRLEMLFLCLCNVLLLAECQYWSLIITFALLSTQWLESLIKKRLN